jgi:hypothetical protein
VVKPKSAFSLIFLTIGVDAIVLMTNKTMVKGVINVISSLLAKALAEVNANMDCMNIKD